MATPLTYGAFQAVMRGSILSSQRCPVCASLFKHKEAIGLFCPNHPDIVPNKFMVRFGEVTRRFTDYQSAFQFLTGLRFQRGSGNFDPRDYQIGKKPLSFSTLLYEWLEHKRQEIKPESYRTLSDKVSKALPFWGDINVKDISYGHVEDLLKAVEFSSKSKKDMLAGLKAFFVWLKKRHDIEGPKDWPKLGVVEMRFRNTIDLESQEAVINDIKANEPFRAWLAIKFLATYISIRPGELISLTEAQVDRHRGLLIIPHPKEKKPKIVPLVEEDAEIIRSIPIGFPGLPFFRHLNAARDADNGNAFTNHYLLRVWKRACARLGIFDVDLYGGTKHSTAMGLREVATFEEVRSMTGHSTNKAFERYFRSEGKDLQALYDRRQKVLKSRVHPEHGMNTELSPFKKDKPSK